MKKMLALVMGMMFLAACATMTPQPGILETIIRIWSRGRRVAPSCAG